MGEELGIKKFSINHSFFVAFVMGMCLVLIDDVLQGRYTVSTVSMNIVYTREL